jgi:hypothetical protein
MIIQFNSIQFSEYLLRRRLNSASTNYKASTKAQKNQYKYTKQNTKQTKQKQYCRKGQYKRSIVAKALYPEKTEMF